MNDNIPEISFDTYVRTVLAFTNDDRDSAQAVHDAELFLYMAEKDFGRWTKARDRMQVYRGNDYISVAEAAQDLTGIKRSKESLKFFEEFILTSDWANDLPRWKNQDQVPVGLLNHASKPYDDWHRDRKKE